MIFCPIKTNIVMFCQAKGAAVTCKKVYSSAVERARAEVKDTDQELRLLKEAIETSEVFFFFF